MTITRVKKYDGAVDFVTSGNTAEALTGTTGSLSFTAGRLVLVKVAGIAGNDGLTGFTVAASG